MQKERSWTDEQLREAVRRATSLIEVIRALGLKSGSGGYVARCINESGLDTSHFTSNINGPRIASDERLRDLVPKCTSPTEMLDALGVELHSNNFIRLRKRIGLLGL